MTTPIDSILVVREIHENVWVSTQLRLGNHSNKHEFREERIRSHTI